MHVVPRSKLGKHRYAFPRYNGRPGCRECHRRQESGELEFALIDRQEAVLFLNKVLKVKLPEPVE